MIQSNFIYYKCALKAGTQIKKGIGEVGDVGDQFRGDIFIFKDCPSDDWALPSNPSGKLTTILSPMEI